MIYKTNETSRAHLLQVFPGANARSENLANLDRKESLALKPAEKLRSAPMPRAPRLRSGGPAIIDRGEW